VISIAAIHHLSSHERRCEALREMIRVTRPGGLILVFAWALEQPQTSSLYKHHLQYLDPDNKQDVLVPWKNKLDGVTHLRYYHLFREGELKSLADPEAVVIEKSGYDKDNWYVIYRKHS